MSKFFHVILKALLWLWHSVAAVIALALIIVAFIIGARLAPSGGPRHDDAPATTTTATTEAQPEPTDKVQMYTCSMHPWVRSPDPDAKCPICFMDLIPVTDSAGDEGSRELVMSEAGMMLAEIETTEVVRKIPTAEVRLVGTVDYDETRLTHMTARFSGRLDRLFVDYTGVPVRKGDHLFEIYSPELLSAQEELIQAARSAAAGEPASDLLLTAAREKLRLWDLTPEQIRQIETSGSPTDHVTVYAPTGGVVIHMHQAEGAYVKTGARIYTLADLSRLWVVLDAYESDLPWLRYGQEVGFTTDAHPGETFTGVISFISPTLDEATRTVKVRVNVDNAGGRLKPGMFVRAIVQPRIGGGGRVINESLAGKWICPMHPEVVADEPGACDVCGMDLVPAEDLGYETQVDEGEPPLVIPVSAPLITGTRAVVYVRVPDTEKPTFEGREVVLGPRAGDVYLVESGLEEGELVVTHGAFKIDSAMQISAKPSMMSPPEADESSAEDAREGEQETPPAMQRLTGVPAAFIGALDPVYGAYFEVQEALAGDDFDGFKASVMAMHKAIGAIDASSLDPAASKVWDDLTAKLLTKSEHIHHLADIEAARALFEVYAAAMIDMDRAFGHTGEQTHYVTHCPMAFDFRGADWLSRVEQINNPYFGEAMLRCGSVEQTIEGGANHD